MVPALVEAAARRRQSTPAASGMVGVAGTAPDTPLAFAALEMAVADAHLRAEGRSLAGARGGGPGGRARCRGRASSSTIDALVAEVATLVEQGFSRVKMKIGPGWDVEPLAAWSATSPASGSRRTPTASYCRSDMDHLAELDRFGLLCLEQPFDRDDLARPSPAWPT